MAISSNWKSWGKQKIWKGRGEHLSQNLADPHHMVAQNSTKPSWIRKANAPSLPQWSQDLVFSRRSRWGFSQVSFGTGGGNPCDKKTQILEGYWSQAFSKVRTVIRSWWSVVSSHSFAWIICRSVPLFNKAKKHSHKTSCDRARTRKNLNSGDVIASKSWGWANSFYSQLIASKNNQTISKKRYHIQMPLHAFYKSILKNIIICKYICIYVMMMWHHL